MDKNQHYPRRKDSATHLIIAKLHERDGAITMTSDEIARLSNRTRRSITTALAHLEEDGVILEMRHRGNAHNPSGRPIRLASGAR